MLTQRDSRRMSRNHADAAEIMPDMQDSSLVSMNDAPSDDAGSNHHDNPESNCNNHNSPYHCRIQKYLQKRVELNNIDEKFKDECAKYVLHRGILHNAHTGKRIILNLEFMKETLEFGHNDIQHYGKRATSKAVVQRFDVTKDLSMEGRKVLDGCIPC